MRGWARWFLPFWLALRVCAPLGQSTPQQTKIRFTCHPVPSEVISQRLGDVPRKNRERAERLQELFVAAGCPVAQITRQIIRDGQAPNVICTLPETSGRMIVVGGHSDHVERGLGVVDDWSGTALLPSLYESLKEQPRRHTFIFIGFATEEKGLGGSKYYVRQLAAGGVTKIRAMINLECLGMAPAEVWASHADARLLGWLGDVLRSMRLPLRAVNVDRVGYDDAMTFRDRNVPTLTLHSLTGPTLGVLHSEKDNYSAIDSTQYYDSYRLIAAYLALLDEVLD